MATISATRWADAASACRRGPAVSEAVMNVHFVAALPLRGGPRDRIDRRPSTPRFNGGWRKIQAERGCRPRPRAGRVSQFDLIGRSVFCRLWGRPREGDRVVLLDRLYFLLGLMLDNTAILRRGVRGRLRRVQPGRSGSKSRRGFRLPVG
jgi:hypothetical protein